MAHPGRITLTRLIAVLLPVLLLTACVTAPGCAKPAEQDGIVTVQLDGRTFHLELAADNPTRERGLGGRESIADDGGMFFSFPDSQIRHFVMRDCLVPIDIIYLDADARIVAMHHMTVEEPRRDNETALQYETRLKRYSSRFNARYVIEIRGGLLEELDLQTGQRIELDTERLAALTS